MRNIFFVSIIICLLSCKERVKETLPIAQVPGEVLAHAKGFTLEKTSNGLTIIKVLSPWPNAQSGFTYALVPKNLLASITLNNDEYDAIVTVPVERMVLTSTTHIPALEALGVEDKLVGFSETDYISSEKTRKRIDAGLVKELGSNESINTEMVIALNPGVVIGFAVDGQNKAYETLQRSNIAVVYNGDWAEETPLGKAEWIKFFAPFFEREAMADRIFEKIEHSYNEARSLAKTAKQSPTVLEGALYKDVWYLPGGNSWAAQFLEDANANYLWKDTPETGSISLSWESVLETAQDAQFWIGPAQFTSYTDMSKDSPHYKQFNAFKKKQVFTFAATKGATGGLLYYELAPQRPDLVLKDLISILHPELLPEHRPFFFKPLE